MSVPLPAVGEANWAPDLNSALTYLDNATTTLAGNAFTTAGGTLTGPLSAAVYDNGGEVLNLNHPAYGAKGDAFQITDAALSTTVLTTSSSRVPAPGIQITVMGAGAAGVNLTTTISSATAGSWTLAASASTTVSGAFANVGTDDTAAITSAITAATAIFALTGQKVVITGKPGAIYKVSYGGTAYAYNNQTSTPAIVLQSGVVLQGISFLAPDYSGTSVAVIGDQGTTAAITDWAVNDCSVNGSALATISTEYLHQGILIGNSTLFQIRRNTFTGFRQNCIETITTTGTSLSVAQGWIDSNYFTESMGGGCRIHGGQDLWVTNNVAMNPLNATYAAVSSPNCIILAGSYTHQQILIAGNRVYGWGIGYDLDGTCIDVVFRDNYNLCPSSGKGNGLQCSTSGVMTRVAVVNNMFDQSAAITSGNFATPISMSGLMTNVLVAGNFIKCPPNSGGGIAAGSAASGSARVVFRDNIIDNITTGNPSAGGWISCGNIADLKIHGNSIDATGYTGSNDVGILVSATCSAASVQGNNLNLVGISILAADTQVLGNQVIVAFSPASPCINIGSVAGCLVADNILTQNFVSVNQHWIAESGTGPNLYRGNTLLGAATVVIPNAISLGGSSTSRVVDNPYFNPVGVVTPAVPGTTVAVATVGYTRTFYITTTAAVSVAISNGPTIVLPTAGVTPVRVPGGASLTPTYSSTAPTWVVEGE